MQLLMTPTSPYARKARVVALEKQLDCEMREVSPWDDDPAVLQVNPLRKAPALLLDDGSALLESRLICEYLDSLSDSPRFFPQEAAALRATKNRAALIEGALDAAGMVVMSGRVDPATKERGDWREWLLGKTRRTLAILENDIAGRGGMDISDVACFCLLDFLLFRLPDEDWRGTNPQLAAWFDGVAGRDSFVQTDPRKG